MVTAFERAPFTYRLLVVNGISGFTRKRRTPEAFCRIFRNRHFFGFGRSRERYRTIKLSRPWSCYYGSRVVPFCPVEKQLGNSRTLIIKDGAWLLSKNWNETENNRVEHVVNYYYC